MSDAGEALCVQCGHRPAAACEECRRALALFADYAPDEFEHPDGAAAGFYAIARHPETGRGCRLCGAGRAALCTYCLLELAADHRRAVRAEA